MNFCLLLENLDLQGNYPYIFMYLVLYLVYDDISLVNAKFKLSKTTSTQYTEWLFDETSCILIFDYLVKRNFWWCIKMMMNSSSSSSRIFVLAFVKAIQEDINVILKDFSIKQADTLIILSRETFDDKWKWWWITSWIHHHHREYSFLLSLKLSKKTSM